MYDFYLTREVAELLDVSEVSLSNWRRESPPVGPPCVKVGLENQYPKSVFRDYLERLTGGNPVPRNLSTEEKRKMFARLHREGMPPLEVGPSRMELAERLAVVEKALAKLKRRKRIRQRVGLAV